ncbi:uncharacterized protein SPSK_03694 [Sporothrix schenckii 1099-18]|uniref:Stress-response A/B barrel domain-containing protein n=2 Tax=Sporothrix schenckii TaxID=29908 RepID=U7PRT8_SPOS1|nr:uncharacterized protein SPSK_03694 [Sporothrix schenckii 1099-18]ERS97424.1 hypothetical protein HMPREF1624_05591 [Sporothrix schenckii ATCC 58251]KJR81920.1 hypothetical protein SPSK_03694 [Sporothrix schenckii 1099-18]
MTITHVVLLQFKESADAEVLKAGLEQFLNLNQTCVHPTTKQPYVLSMQGGKDTSIEHFQNGHTHAFVAEFATVEDLQYYVKEDPVHQAFLRDTFPLVEKITTMNFESGKL